MTRSRVAKIVVDTNVFIETLEKSLTELEGRDLRDPCRYAIEMLRKMIMSACDALAPSQYVHLMPRQIDEVARWVMVNVCERKGGVAEDIRVIFSYALRLSSNLGKGFRYVKRSEVRSEERLLTRRYGRVQRQVTSISDEVDRAILYFALGKGAKGASIKVITMDEELTNKLLSKTGELGIRRRVLVKLVKPEEISLQNLGPLLRDP